MSDFSSLKAQELIGPIKNPAANIRQHCESLALGFDTRLNKLIFATKPSDSSARDCQRLFDIFSVTVDLYNTETEVQSVLL